MSDKLCPFCGGSECYSVDDYGDVSVACLYKTHGDTWNTRPLEDAANARAEAAEAKVAALQAELTRAIDIYKDPAVAHANILNGRIVLPSFYVNITDDFGPVADLRAALAAANEDAERLASVLEDDGYPVKRLPMNAKRLSLAAHRARVGGAS